MGTFGDKFNSIKQKASEKIKEANLDEKISNAKQKIGDTVSDIKQKSEESKATKEYWKAPVDGALIRYRMVYDGGLEQFQPKSSDPKSVGFNILSDRFVIKPEYYPMREWFGEKLYEIPYSKVKLFKTSKRGMGSSADIESIVNITFITEDDKERTIRLEMLDGTTYVGQELKCREMVNFLKDNNIYDLLVNKSEHDDQNDSNEISSTVAITEQIKKVKELYDLGIISEEEFNQKKTELLAKM